MNAACHSAVTMLLRLLLLAIVAAAAPAVTQFTMTLARGEARRSSAGIFRSGGGLVTQLWANRPTPGRHPALAAETLAVAWDRRDSLGSQLVRGRAAALSEYELRWIDTSSVSYEWEGVAGNTGPSVGQHVLRSLDSQTDLAIAGNVGIRAVGYNEAEPSVSMFSTATPSQSTTLAHADYHRVFDLVATDGTVAYMANTAVVTSPPSFFFTGVTWVMGVDISSNCEHNFTSAGRSQCTMGYGQHAGGELGNWSFCKPKGSICRYPGSECSNNGATQGNYDGCNGKAEYFHSVIDFAFDPRKVNDTADGLNPNCDPKKGCADTGTNFLQAATGLAVQRGLKPLLFIAHAFLNVVRVVDKTTGKSICNATMEMPRRMTVSEDGASLWVIVSNTSVAKFDTNKLCADPVNGGTNPQPEVTIEHLASPAALSVSPTTKEVAIADRATVQIHIFSEDGAAAGTLGKEGGYGDGNPSVNGDRFFWIDGKQIFLAHESDGSLWVADTGNLRTIHLDSTGKYLQSVEWVVASYTSTVSSSQPNRVFSNYREYDVQYSKGATPLNQSWTLVRNWAAGLDSNWSTCNSHFEGLHAVHQTPDNKTIGLVRTAAASNSPTLVELPSQPGLPLRPIWTLPESGAFNLEKGAVLRYTNSLWKRGSQALGLEEIYETPYDPATGNWTLPGTLVASFETASDRLAPRFSGVHATYPKTASGDYVIFDGSSGKNESYNTHPNQGFHLGAVGPGANQTQFKWQASPWGFWEINKSPIVLDGINCTLHTIANADGRFGANDSAIQYAGSYAMAEGSSIVFGFFGEFWKGSEANQFLHFHDSGLFVGQFGTISQFGSMGLSPQIPGGDPGGEFEVFHYALPGEAGNSFSPSLVTGTDGLLYFYHNDESKHDGVHRWVLQGAEALAMRTEGAARESEAERLAEARLG